MQRLDDSAPKVAAIGTVIEASNRRRGGGIRRRTCTGLRIGDNAFCGTVNRFGH
ncbi:MAG TPA: hypothetical protein VGQ18_02580 [Gemmatimonadales bacterium]|nr:hypothetical protein [Gemmatimonadales bacterium]